MKNIPLIDSYESFFNFNEDMKCNIGIGGCVNVENVDNHRNFVIIDSEQYDLDEFLINFIIKQDAYIGYNIDLFEDYDFSRVYARTHPEEFKNRISAYIDNLVMLGEDEFKVWECNLKIRPDGIMLTSWDDLYRENLIVPYGVTIIRGGIFQSWHHIKRVELPSTLKEIGQYAFAECCNLEEIIMPDSVEIVGVEAFHGCSKLKHVTFSRNLHTLESRSFMESGVEEVVLPNNLTCISKQAFSHCEKLKSVKLPRNLKKIEQSAFQYADIESIKIPDSVTYIGEYAFYNCDKLKSVRLSNSLSKILKGSFSSTGLETLYVPDSVINIENYAFSDCTKLKKVDISRRAVQHLGLNSFFGTKLMANSGKNVRVKSPSSSRYIWEVR